MGRGAGVTTRTSGDLHRIPHPQRATQFIDRTGRFIPGRVTAHSGCFWRRVSLPPSERFRPSSPCPPPSSSTSFHLMATALFRLGSSIYSGSRRWCSAGSSPYICSSRMVVDLSHLFRILPTELHGWDATVVNRLRGNASLRYNSSC